MTTFVYKTTIFDSDGEYYDEFSFPELEGALRSAKDNVLIDGKAIVEMIETAPLYEVTKRAKIKVTDL